MHGSWRKIGGAARQDPEFELLDTGVFDEDRYFDVLWNMPRQRRKTF